MSQLQEYDDPVMGLWRHIAQFAQRALLGEEPPGDEAEAGRDIAFTIAVIGLGAKLAKADGRVTPDEVAAFRSVFVVPPEAEDEAARVFALAQSTTLGYESYARQLARRWRAFPALLEDVLDGLFYVAAADGEISADEVAYLERVADIFGLGAQEFARIRASWLGADADDPYLILGVDADISDADLVRAYRRVAAANHPDSFAARGLPHSAQLLAHEKMAAINAAYDAVRRARGLKSA